MVTISVGAVDGHEEWHLPTYDPRNENKYHYKLHSLDIYFWTQQDALQFVNGIRRLLPPNQIDVLDEPGPPPRHDAAVSAVVQKLENAAISDPTYASAGQTQNGVPSFAPPPLSAVSGGSPSPQPQTHNFAPIAYNPAAPAAPEAIRHREKTPPPEDGGLNPLHATLVHDASTPFSPGLPIHPSGLGPLSPGIPPPAFHSPPGAPSFPGPPIGSPGLPPSGYGSLGPGHPGLTRAATMPVHGMASPMTSPYGGQFPGSPGFAPLQQPHLTPTPPISSPGMPPPPPGGYSQYSYANQGPGLAGGVDYSVHQQAYRPTEGETAVNYQPKKEVRGKVEENAGRLERGVTGMLKKFEKKFG
ncbi:putative rna recognition motif-containing protein [Phaeoacremonium minimum UCRPA7]|uniref:Putative rna recognition motif-containing protein n=1 Tax=Phaeoacremonium minimum (strain UCR-PA7) TaxID=1286976 RepID=R8BHL6_PHAM7|nr:putative rna recognition motif-containing protein [Phaeoacremonium minimum UCRPA7]EON98810.1 putative rna recognition motif-containing protein [Phaeoacremonium minimum UCRPA7]